MAFRYEEGDAESALSLLRESMALWYKPPRDSDSEDEDESDDDEDDEGSEGDGRSKADREMDDIADEMASLGLEDEGPSYEFR